MVLKMFKDSFIKGSVQNPRKTQRITKKKITPGIQKALFSYVI